MFLQILCFILTEKHGNERVKLEAYLVCSLGLTNDLIDGGHVYLCRQMMVFKHCCNI